MENHPNMKYRFTRQLSGTQIALGFLVIYPFYFIVSRRVALAIMKAIILVTGLKLDYDTFANWDAVLLTILVIISLVIVYKDFLVRQLKDIKKDYVKFISGIVKGIILIFIATIIGNLCSYFLSGSSMTANESGIRESLVASPIPMLIYGVLLGPFQEEMLFRGILFTSIRKHSRILAYIATGVGFGLLHVYSYLLAGNIGEIVHIFPYLFAGLAFGYIYESSDNIWAGVLAHMILNGFAMGSTLLG